MLKAIIIEDERLAMQDLVNTLYDVAPDVQVAAKLFSVKESIEYLSGSTDADIIFSDVQLADGLSFEIFNYTDIEIPIVFITGYDEFIMNAFEYFFCSKGKRGAKVRQINGRGKQMGKLYV